MQAEERHAKIEAYLRKAEFASLEELARQVGVSVSTVRRDVAALEENGGKVARTHGGARWLAGPAGAGGGGSAGGVGGLGGVGGSGGRGGGGDEHVLAVRDASQVEEKEAIGAACAALVWAGENVILDSGTTCLHVARHLDAKVAQIITNSLPVANLFAGSSRHEVHLSGGTIYPRLGTLVGPQAVESFARMHADVAILSGGGITSDGITNSHELILGPQRAMIAAAARVIFCFDHTKFGRKSPFFLCDFADVDTVVTDARAPAGLVAELRAKGIEVVVA